MYGQAQRPARIWPRKGAQYQPNQVGVSCLDKVKGSVMHRKYRGYATSRDFQREIRLMFLLAAAVIFGDAIASPQALSIDHAQKASIAQSSFASVCHETSADAAALAALRLVCQQGPIARGAAASGEPIVIGFLGGFARADDLKHPEVLFASYLRQHYAPALHAQVFRNHDEQGALAYVTRLLDQDHDGLLSDEERRSARIIIYGHSWGASETAEFARDLGRRG
ncbi:MAG: hypothetical protein WBF42_07370, partial [Terracidiphilus sp.]